MTDRERLNRLVDATGELRRLMSVTRKPPNRYEAEQLRDAAKLVDHLLIEYALPVPSIGDTTIIE